MEAQAIASNLARLRAEARLSQAELAEKAGLSRLTLGKIERGEVVPRSDTLSDLAESLKVSLSELVTPVRPLVGVRFRAQRRVNTREQVLAHVSRWFYDYNELEDLLEEKRAFVLEPLVGTGRPPQLVAQAARDALELGPKESIRDVCGLLEDRARIKLLLLKRSNDLFYGLSVSPEGGGPAIVVNTWERISVERWIFTTAHELGHLLLHTASYDRNLDVEDKEQEKEADRFASYFLMPRDAFESEWSETYGLRLLDRVMKLKRNFHVSYKTVLFRLVEEEHVSKDVWKFFQVQHRQRFGTTLAKAAEPAALSGGESGFRWNRATEPDGLSPFDFVEDRLHRLVRQALERDMISYGRAAEILGLPLTGMRELAVQWAR